MASFCPSDDGGLWPGVVRSCWNANPSAGAVLRLWGRITPEARSETGRPRSRLRESGGDMSSLCVSKSNLLWKDDVRLLPTSLRCREAYHLAAKDGITESCHWRGPRASWKRGENGDGLKFCRRTGWMGRGEPVRSVGEGGGRGVTHSVPLGSQEVAGQGVKMASFPGTTIGSGVIAVAASMVAWRWR